MSRVRFTRAGGFRRATAGLLWLLSVATAHAADPVQDWAAVAPDGGTAPALFGSNSVPSNKYAIAVDAAGNTFVTGSLSNGTNTDYFTQKIGPDGGLLWSAIYNGPGDGNDTPVALALDSDGNVVVTGRSAGSSTGFDFATLKYDGATGATLWSGGAIIDGAARYNGTDNGFDNAIALAIDVQGDVLVTGSISTVSEGNDFATLKYDGATGATLWSGGAIVDGAALYNGPVNGQDTPRALALDAAGNPVVTGLSDGSGTDVDYATLKYDGATGAPMWSGGAIVAGAARFDGPANGYDVVNALVIDGAGNVLVTGGSTGSGSFSDYATLKYDGATGAPLWSGGAIVSGAARYNGPDSRNDTAYALVLDADGNVVVTGVSASNASNDIATLKFDGATGAPLWSGGAIVDGAARYLAPKTGGSAFGYALALDGDGNAVVVAPSEGNGTGYDYTVLNYGAASGSLNWEHRYEGGMAAGDRSYAIVRADDGSLRVGGTANTAQGDRIVVLKLRKARSEARLAALDVSGHAYLPAFDADQLAYEASVDSAASADVSATAQDANASIAIAGEAAEIGASTRTVALGFGDNPLAIEVHAEDGVELRSYGLTLYRAEIALDAPSLAQTYDGTPRPATASTQPASLAHALSYEGIDGTIYGPSTSAPTAAGRYAVTATLTATHYSGTASATLEVAKSGQSLAFGANPGPLTYGGAAGSVAATATSGLPVTYASATPACMVDAATGAVTIVAAGDCVVTASQDGDGNFSAAAPVQQTVVIEPRALHITAEAQRKTYGEADPVLGYSTDAALVDGDEFSGSLVRAAGEDVGSYAINLGSLDAGPNYRLDFTAAELSIEAATLTYVAQPARFDFGVAPSGLTGSVTGFVGNDSLASATTGSAVFTTTAQAGDPVGSYPISGSGLAANRGNYVFEQAAGNATALTIGTATAVVTLGALERTYDGQPQAGEATTTPAGLAIALSYDGQPTPPTDAGSYAVVATITEPGYVGNSQGTLTIAPATLTYVAQPAHFEFGVAPTGLTGSVTGFVGGDSLATATTGNLVFTTTAQAGDPVGSYPIIGGGLTANRGNYMFVQAAGNASALDITPRSFTVTASVDGAHGSVSPSGSQSVPEGDSIEFTVTPDAGYGASIGGTCGGTLAGARFTTDPVTAACTVVARFTPLPVPPGSPQAVTVVLDRAGATVQWSAPGSDGGSPILAYAVTVEPGGLGCTVTGDPPPTTCRIEGLQPGTTYTFAVVASNSAGQGAPAMVSAATALRPLPEVIPAASPRGLLGLAGLLAIAGMVAVRRQRVA